MAIINRASRLAVVVETTEGTLKAPSSGSTDYLAPQDDLTLSPAFDVMENAELKNSLGKAKSILGAEHPTASFSHYLRGSAVAGTAPDFAELLQASLGAESIIATERNTVASSTTTIINVDTGEGAEFERGDILLIKDATNGYSLRPVESISSDNLTIGFPVTTAPGTGVDLGRSILYKPVNDTSHQALSIWHYGGNGGLTQAVAGCKVTGVTITANAGELINANYSLEGIGYYYNPVILAATDTKIDWVEDSGTKVGTIAAGPYKSPDALASAIQTAMQGQSAATITVVYSDSTGKYTITASGTAVFTLKWNTGANAANTIGDAIGFSVAADDTGALTYTSDNAITLSSPQSPTFDSADPLAAKNMEVFIGDGTTAVCFEASTLSFSLETPKTDIKSVCAESGIDSSIINSRAASVSVTALVTQYDVDMFERYRNNTQTRFLFNFGEKSGGNWVATKCGHIYMPTCTLTEFSISQQDGLIVANLKLTSYVNAAGDGEVYIAFV